MPTNKPDPRPPLELRPDPANPNRLDDATKAELARALAEFGDLSGVIVNRRTGLLIGGHQRADVLRDGKLDVTDLPKPEPDGTVARGHLEHLGRRYAVRVVDWPEDKAHAALLAANRYGRRGEDDAAILKTLLEELDCGQTTDTGQLLADLTGYDAAERERLATQYHVDVVDQSGDEDTRGDRQGLGGKRDAMIVSVGMLSEVVPRDMVERLSSAIKQRWDDLPVTRFVEWCLHENRLTDK